MNRVILFALLAIVLLGSAIGCKTNEGAREFIPGKGWVPVE